MNSEKPMVRKAQAVNKNGKKKRMAPVPEESASLVAETAVKAVAVMPSPPAVDANQQGRYVYGIIQGTEPVTFGKIGIGGTGELVYGIAHGDILAVVSRTQVS